MSRRHQDDHRALSDEEVARLRENGCRAEDWNTVTVRPATDVSMIRDVVFIGEVRLGNMNGLVNVNGLGDVRPLISNVTIANSQIGDDNYISNVGLISCYTTGDKNVIVDSGRISASEDVRQRMNYGIGVRVGVVNEAGGREVALSRHLSSNIAYIVAMHSYKRGLREAYERLVEKEAQTAEALMGRRVSIYGVKTIDHVQIGGYTTIEGADVLRNGTILSVKEQATYIGHGVQMNDFVVAEGAKIDGAAQLTKAYIGQCCTVAGGFYGENLLAFACSQLLCGEAVAVMAGPYTVSHHKSTLLIAQSCSFYNAGSGTNVSNHHYRLGPSHQLILDRGVKTGSDSYVLEPAHIGAFTMIVGRHKTNPDTSAYPFSILAEREGESHLLIAQNMRTMGIFRDSQKWRKRDMRTLKRDCVSYDVLNPMTVGKMIEAIGKMKQMEESKQQHIIVECGIRYHKALLPRAEKAYKTAVDFYLCKAYLHDKGQSESFDSEWIDCGGLIAPKGEIEDIEDRLIRGEYESVEDIGKDITDVHIHSWEAARMWAVGKAREIYGYTDTEEDVTDAAQHLAEACQGMREALVSDASKEWGPRMDVGYGAVGNDEDASADFCLLHGTAEQNVDVIECQRYFDETK